MIHTKILLPLIASLASALPLAVNAQSAALNSATKEDDFGIVLPNWMTELSLGVKEGYDSNLLGVSGYGLRPKESFFTTISPKIALNLAPAPSSQSAIKVFSLTYSPDLTWYYNAPEENYRAQKIGNVLKAKLGDFSFSADNSFLYNDGDTVAPTYAVNPSSATDANDRFRNFYAFAMPRERREQIQDRANVTMQYDVNQVFVRPTASLIYYDLMTEQRLATAASGNLGYQNFPDRYDVNGGADLGYKLSNDLAVTIGYRYGHQYQAPFPLTVSPADQHFASSDYHRILLGVEGKCGIFTFKVLGGPDFRDYNSMAAVNDFHPVKYYGEASISAKLTDNQSLTLNCKQWEWVAASGLVPYFDSSFALNYHINATKKLGLDLGGKIVEADFTGGNETGALVASQTASQRDDRMYSVMAGMSYAFTSRLGTTLSYSYDYGANVLGTLPAGLIPTAQYRNFSHQLVTAGITYKF